MIFRTVKTQLESILNAGAGAGGYRVAGYQPQDQSADQVKDSLRVVRVFFDSGDFPKSAGSRLAYVTHDLTFSLEFTVAKASAGDLSALNDESAGDAQRAASLATFTDAGQAADDSLDEFFDTVYAVLMSAARRDLGLATGTVSNTWIPSMRKDKPASMGGLVVLTGTMNFNCRVSESLDGLTGTAAGQTGAVLAAVDVYMNETTKDAGQAAVSGGN